MKRVQAITLSLLTAALMGSVQAQSLRPEVGKPLQQAYELIKAGKGREALAKVREAENVGNKSAAETLQVERMKAAAAQRAGEHAAAIQALESLHGKVGASEQGQVAEQLAASYAAIKDNAKATQWVQKAQAAGNHSATLQQLQTYLLGASGDHAAIAREAAAAVASAEQAGRRPDENDLLRLADAQQRSNNAAGQIATLEKLIAHYPKKAYWAAALARLPRKPGFADRFGLDLLRLRLGSGNLTEPNEVMEMAQLALQAGLAVEARQVVDQGFASGVLGTGPEAARHQRLKALADQQAAEFQARLPALTSEAQAAKDGNALVQLGVALASGGQAPQGVALIEQGIAKGQLKRPQDAQLRLGRALMLTGQHKARAQQLLRSVSGTDGVADIARLYALAGH